MASYPSAQSYDADLIKQVEKAKDVVAKVRELRNSNGIKQRDPLALFVEDSDSAKELFGIEGLADMVQKMAYLKSLEVSGSDIANSLSFLSGTEKYFLEVELEIDVEAEREKLTKELEYYEGFVKSVEKKLSNERFVQNAPAPVVEKERQKLADGQAKIQILKENLAKL
jgi:valyl-tRNA synthetase